MYGRFSVNNENGTAVFGRTTTFSDTPALMAVAGANLTLTFVSRIWTGGRFSLSFYAVYPGVPCPAEPLLQVAAHGVLDFFGQNVGMTPNQTCVWDIQRNQPVTMYLENVYLPQGATVTVVERDSGTALASLDDQASRQYLPPVTSASNSMRITLWTGSGGGGLTTAAGNILRFSGEYQVAMTRIFEHFGYLSVLRLFFCFPRPAAARARCMSQPKLLAWVMAPIRPHCPP